MEILERIRAVLEHESEAIRSIPVDDSYVKAVEAILAIDGKVITTGMGKAGHMARKFGATLCSTGTPATYLHPSEAAHGDLGLISASDCIVAFSTSGKTVEVLEMLELARHLGVQTIIGITSHPDSQLRELADLILNMGVLDEACPLGLTPSSSIAAMLAVSDCLALALLEQRGFTAHDFGLRHHGGYLGRKARTDNE